MLLYGLLGSSLVQIIAFIICGDSGYGDHFRTIGEKLGPIEIGFIKIGDNGEDLGWRDIHMHTEQSIPAAKDLKANIMFPIRWGTLNLSNHDWYEPINLAVQYI